VSPMRYELGFYIKDDGILHSHRHENRRSYLVWLNLNISLTAALLSHGGKTPNIHIHDTR
jgi:hypothetical protein